ITRFFPSMSPRRPAMGVATAPASSVAVTAQVKAPGVVSNRGGRIVSRGAMSECIIATSVHAVASTRVTRAGAGEPGGAAAEVGPFDDGSDPLRRRMGAVWGSVVDEVAAAARMRLQGTIHL